MDSNLYVTQISKVARAEQNVPSENPTSIYTKLNKYPYEFEINAQLQLASINGIKTLGNTENTGIYRVGSYTGVTVSAGTSL